MYKYLLLLACLTGVAMADNIDVQTEVYIVAGILGGACLLLTIASIYNSVTIIGLQSKVAVLQAAGTATVKAVARVAENTPPSTRKFPAPSEPPQNPYGVSSLPRDPYANREDPYRRQEPRQEPRGGYRMERLHSYYDDYRSNNKPHGGQSSRPYQDDRRPNQDDRRPPPAGYY